MSSLRTKHTKKAGKDAAAKNGVPSKNVHGDVLTLGEAADYLRVREQDVMAMVSTQGLQGRQIGTEWRFLKSALQNWLGGGASKSSKQALLNLAGKFKDDPYLKEITREAYKKRGRSSSEADE